VAKVLVVDDDDNMRRLIKTVLERRGHQVSEARDGLEGLASYDKDCPDLVVTDVVMPGMGGLALMAELHKRASPPKILIVSGKHFRLDGEGAALADRGLIRIMAKPFTPAEISGCVHALVG
jgi:CheY-like chemotaxis protein